MSEIICLLDKNEKLITCRVEISMALICVKCQSAPHETRRFCLSQKHKSSLIPTSSLTVLWSCSVCVANRQNNELRFEFSQNANFSLPPNDKPLVRYHLHNQSGSSVSSDLPPVFCGPFHSSNAVSWLQTILYSVSEGIKKV